MQCYRCKTETMAPRPVTLDGHTIHICISCEMDLQAAYVETTIAFLGGSYPAPARPPGPVSLKDIEPSTPPPSVEKK